MQISLKSHLEIYCKAWNEGDLDGIFRLFREDAHYDGTSKQLRGLDAIRQMYQETFESGAAKQLVAHVVQLKGGMWGVVLYKHAQVVALKEFNFSNGLIVSHTLIEDPDIIASMLAP